MIFNRIVCVILTYMVGFFLSTTAKCSPHNTQKYVSGGNTDAEEAFQFLAYHDKLSSKFRNKDSIADWNYQTNLTEENKKIMLQSFQESAEFNKEAWKNATSFAWKNFKDTNSTIYRWFKKLSVLGTDALQEDKLNEFNSIIADMSETYGAAKICPYGSPPCDSCNLSLEPDLNGIMSTSQNYYELAHVWTEWRDKTGKQLKDKFLEYVELSNEAASLNGFSDSGEYWRDFYESENFKDEIEELLCGLFPFYQQLHAYVRSKLIEKYSACKIKPDGPIPAHLLGNMWGQEWGNIFEIVKPFPSKMSADATPAMKRKNMTPLDMFKLSEKFFTSLGLKKMTREFWNRSLIEKPTDRELVCHAEAADFSDGRDFRIKQCTVVKMEDLITTHHEMGHVQYYMQYAHQPVMFRGGANPGFHEAVGDTIALSVASPRHLKKIHLIEDYTENEENDINTLMKMALDKLAFIPFGYLIDAWRWGVFDGSFDKDELNTKWWELRLKYQGLCPPTKRTNDHLDAASKYHVVADVPYIRYFVSYVVQFQFHKALCDEAGHKGPLHKCDIYQSKKAGKLFSKMLSLGSSKPWKEAMSIITKGKTEKMDTKPMLEYFSPLLKWLKKQNKNNFIGWRSDNPMECP